MGFKDSTLPKLSNGISKFSNNRYIRIMMQGMMGIMAITIAGSFAQILANLSFMPQPIAAICRLAATVSTSLVALFIIIGISAATGKEFKCDPVSSIFIGLVSFLILTPISSFEKVSAYNLTYLGSQGIFVAMIVGVLAVRVYAFFIKRNITIKMPDSVPEFISKQFAAIIPAIVVIFASAIINYLLALTSYGNIHDLIYAWLQVPLQGLGGSLWSAFVLLLLSELFWFFGIHGSMATNSIMMALFGTQFYANMEAVAAGLAPEFVLNAGFINAYKGPRHLALAVVLIFFCASKRYKTVGQIAVVPGLFGISEPMKFGIPMVLNPWLLVPMSLAPVISVAIAYIATLIGFIPLVSVQTGFLPAFFTGFLVGGIPGAIVQVVQFVAIVLLYLPFIKKLDRDNVKLEAAEGSNA